MPVKTFKKRKGESWFSVAERKFGDRDIGYDLIKKFGEGRSGVQYRFNSDLARGKAGIGTALAGSLGLNPFGLEGTDVPSTFDASTASKGFREMFPQFFDGTGAGAGAGEFVPPTAPTLPGQTEDRTLSEIEDLLGGLEATGGPSEGGQRVGGRVLPGPTRTFPTTQDGFTLTPPNAPTVPGTFLTNKEKDVLRSRELFEQFPGVTTGPEEKGTISLEKQTALDRIGSSIGSAFSLTADKIATDIINPLVGFDPQAPSAEPPQPEELNHLSGVTLGRGEADFGLVDPTTGQRVRTDSPTNHPGGWNFGEVTAQADIYSTIFEDGGAPPAMADITARLALEDMDDYEGVLIESGYVFNDETGYWILSTGEPTGSGTNNTGIGLGFYGGAGKEAGRLARARRNQPLTYIPTGSNPFSWRANFG